MAPVPSGPAELFDRAAGTYDAVGVPWFTPIAQGLVEELAVRPGERVLDVGCGRGAALRPLAEATGPTGSALGVDLAPEMVRLTAADLAGLSQVRVELADASALSADAAPYDVVSSCLVLFFLPDPGQALRSWAGLLAPGGRLGVTTFGPQDERWQAVDALFTPYLPKGMLDARTSGARGPFASDEGVEALLRDAGLEAVRTVRRTVTATFSGPEQWERFSWSHGQRAMWEAVPAEHRDGLRQQAQGLLAQWEPLSMVQGVRHTLGRRPA